MVNPILNNASLEKFITSLKINPEQEKVLIENLPNMDAKERIELLKMLKDVYLLNAEEDQAIKKIEENIK
jgi:hypothetical protein